jgi:hypothetical protein
MMANKLESLLNEIYTQVDLKDDVYPFVQPYILKAYALLRNDDISSANGKSQDVLFNDVEQKNAIENILYRDLPGVIDIYTKMPLDYRNEKIVKHNKTHRNLLLENIEILTKKLKEIETEAYSNFDQRMSVSNRFIKEKYDTNNFVRLTESELEVEQEDSKIPTSFNWSRVKGKLAQLNMSNLEKRDFAKDDNKKIVLKENQVEYQVKDKFRHFMAGTYNAYVSVKNVLKTTGKFLKNNAGSIVIFGVIGTVIVGPIVLGIYISHERANAYTLQEGNELINSNNERLKSISVMALNEYAKENKLEIKYTPDKNSVYVYKDMDKGKCMQAIEVFQEHHPNVAGTYTINGLALKASDKLNSKISEGICNLETNKVGTGWSLKLK